MSEVFKVVENIADQAVDILEKTHSAASRVGHATERAAKLAKAGFSHRTIASLLTDNSRTGLNYEASEIPTLIKMNADAEAGGVGITQKQYKGLQRDRKELQAVPKNAKPA